MTRKHTMDEVVRSLSKKRDCKIDLKRQVIEILTKSEKSTPTNDLGNGSWGKIDFLCNYKGFVKIFVTEFSR